jgi:hypothetical protein
MRTTARVTLTIEIEADGCWGENCQLKQIFEQAEESALGKLRKAFQNSPKKIRIIGEPTTEAIMHNNTEA